MAIRLALVMIFLTTSSATASTKFSVRKHAARLVPTSIKTLFKSKPKTVHWTSGEGPNQKIFKFRNGGPGNRSIFDRKGRARDRMRWRGLRRVQKLLQRSDRDAPGGRVPTVDDFVHSLLFKITEGDYGAQIRVTGRAQSITFTKHGSTDIVQVHRRTRGAFVAGISVNASAADFYLTVLPSNPRQEPLIGRAKTVISRFDSNDITSFSNLGEIGAALENNSVVVIDNRSGAIDSTYGSRGEFDRAVEQAQALRRR
jgi:hypothetical protein